jgi:deazaflavin-dependent oxidoreductase (nitroreductase family)
MTDRHDRAADAGFKVLNLGHKAVLRLTGGRWPRALRGMAAVELRTTGRISGQVRSTMLTSPVHDDTQVVLVASKYGDARDPQWYANLSAHPDVDIVIDGMTRAMRARTASAEEKAALWPRIVAAYPNYDAYQRKTSRDIPVVICESRPD